jgi:transcriptional regulator GlxA family with amidase domain
LQKSEIIDLKYFLIDGKNVESMGGLNITSDYSINQINESEI